MLGCMNLGPLRARVLRSSSSRSIVRDRAREPAEGATRSSPSTVSNRARPTSRTCALSSIAHASPRLAGGAVGLVLGGVTGAALGGAGAIGRRRHRVARGHHARHHARATAPATPTDADADRVAVASATRRLSPAPAARVTTIALAVLGARYRRRRDAHCDRAARPDRRDLRRRDVAPSLAVPVGRAFQRRTVELRRARRRRSSRSGSTTHCGQRVARDPPRDDRRTHVRRAAGRVRDREHAGRPGAQRPRRHRGGRAAPRPRVRLRPARRRRPTHGSSGRTGSRRTAATTARSSRPDWWSARREHRDDRRRTRSSRHRRVDGRSSGSSAR